MNNISIMRHIYFVRGSIIVQLIYLNQKLKYIEDTSGRKRNVPKFSARTLDVDIVLQIDEDEIVFESDEIKKYSFVSEPLKEII